MPWHAANVGDRLAILEGGASYVPAGDTSAPHAVVVAGLDGLDRVPEVLHTVLLWVASPSGEVLGSPAGGEDHFNAVFSSSVDFTSSALLSPSPFALDVRSGACWTRDSLRRCAAGRSRSRPLRQ